MRDQFVGNMRAIYQTSRKPSPLTKVHIYFNFRVLISYTHYYPFITIETYIANNKTFYFMSRKQYLWRRTKSLWQRV